MAKNIEPKLLKIEEYLKCEDDTIFNIPEYQRAYSWDIERCDKLWQDIVDFSETDSKDGYFFGTIIINCKENDTIYSLIDGQQRTTSFLLLLKAILTIINNLITKAPEDKDSESLLRGLKARRRKITEILYKVEIEEISDSPNEIKDSQIYKNVKLIDNNSINEQYKEDLKTILKSTNFEEAEGNVIKIKNLKLDNKYSNFFRNYKYFYNKVNELSESRLNKIAKTILEDCEVIEIKSWKVEQAITMFNSLNSDGLPLYDSDIISAKLYAIAEKINKQEELADLWREVNREINEFNLEKNGIVDINSILMQHMYYIRAINKETISETGNINVTMPGLRRYFTEINKQPINSPIEMCQSILNLIKIWSIVAEYPIMKVLLKFNENSKIFLASYFNRFKAEEINIESVEKVIESMLRIFTILEIVETGYSSKYFKSFLFSLQLKLVDKDVGIEEIEKEVHSHIINNWNYDDIKSLIQINESNALVYLNEYLLAKNSNRCFDINARCDIEHIMPISGNSIKEIRRMER